MSIIVSTTLPDLRSWVVPVEDLAIAAAILGACVIVAVAAHRLAFGIIRKATAHGPARHGQPVVEAIRAPALWLAVTIAISAAAERADVIRPAWDALSDFIAPVILGWLVLAFVTGWATAHERRMERRLDPIHMRSRKTRIEIFRRTASSLIIVITIALVLVNIPGVRQVGVTLMASAGLAALAIGAAAQPALKSLIAGVQMALTEPINIDDAVVLEGEWGWIEDIRTTYVVVKIWDERRLVVPTSYFLEKPFQNWTKQTANLLGTVFLHLDPKAKIGPIREEFFRQVEANERWDGRVKVVQVTDTTRDSKEVRLLMSAKNSPTLFDLRCDIREGMMEWLADNRPQDFAKLRLVEATDDAENA